MVCVKFNFFSSKVDHTEVAVLEILYFQLCILNANKIGVVAYFSKVMTVFVSLFPNLSV